MSMTKAGDPQRDGLAALEREMARQGDDALRSFEAAAPLAGRIAASLRRSGRLLMLGMGASHAVGRTVEPFYRALGIDAVAIPLSEQLGAPLPESGRTVLVASQSGESAEVVRWLGQGGATADGFGLTLAPESTLARALPNLAGAGGAETAFAATRSLTVTLAQHLAILAAMGADPGPALARLSGSGIPETRPALQALAGVDTLVVSGRRLRGLAEAAALGFCELSRIPAFALEGGQLRHGPMEMLGPRVGLLQLRSAEAASDLVASLSTAAAEAGSPVVVLDASGEEPVPGAVTLAAEAASDMAAVFALLPLAQRLMVDFAAARVPDVGIPLRSSKITRTE